jgi:hypothetical protein
MPRLIQSRLAAVCVLALILTLSVAAVAAAKGVSANLRVVGAGGKTLAEETLNTGTVSVPTSKKATCFGKGTAGSGKSVTIEGATALGLLGQAARSNSSLRPLLLTDSFSFGLGICGVGGSLQTSKLSWYLKVNHKNPELGGDSVKLKSGDEVLWDLAPYPYPNELALSAPSEALPGVPFTVHVYSYSDKGKRKPAVGATVTGGQSPTAADGSTTVVVGGPTNLRATHGKEIPSNGANVCVLGVCL